MIDGIARCSRAVLGWTSILLAALCSSCGSTGGGCGVREVVYNGWRCVELSNGRVDVVIAPQLGGRIIQLRLDGFEYLAVNRSLAGKVLPIPEAGSSVAGGDARLLEWANYGGDKLWPAPQGWSGPEEWPGPPDPFDKGGRTDRGPFDLQVISSGPHEAAVRLVGPKDLYAGIRFEREIRIVSWLTRIDLKSTMVNVTDRPVRWGIWQVTQHAAPENPGTYAGRSSATDLRAWAPVNPESRYPRGFKVLFGPEENPQFAARGPEPGGRPLFELSYSHQVGKVGLDCDAGWLAVTHEKSGRLLAHLFPAAIEKEHPDGASVEFWASGPGRIVLGDRPAELGADEPWLVESEVLSPFARLEPGESFTFASAICLARGSGPVTDVNDDFAVLKPIQSDEKGKTTGRIAVFRDGTLFIKVLPNIAGVRLGEVRAGSVVDLEESPWASGLETRMKFLKNFLTEAGAAGFGFEFRLELSR